MLPFQDDPEMFSHFPTLVIGPTLTPVVTICTKMNRRPNRGSKGSNVYPQSFVWAGMKVPSPN